MKPPRESHRHPLNQYQFPPKNKGWGTLPKNKQFAPNKLFPKGKDRFPFSTIFQIFVPVNFRVDVGILQSAVTH